MSPIRGRPVPIIRGPVSDALDAIDAKLASRVERSRDMAELKARVLADTADAFTLDVDGLVYEVTDIHFDPQLRAVSMTVTGPGITENHNPFWFYNPPHVVVDVSANGKTIVVREDPAEALRRHVEQSIRLNVKV